MIEGSLDPFFETGTQGIIWSLSELGKGYEGLHSLKNGDYLKVFKKDSGEILWQGVVKLEYERRLIPIPTNPQYKAQEVCGMWVHGFQDSLEPIVWAKMFFDGSKAQLIKNEQKIGE